MTRRAVASSRNSEDKILPGHGKIIRDAEGNVVGVELPEEAADSEDGDREHETEIGVQSNDTIKGRHSRHLFLQPD